MINLGLENKKVIILGASNGIGKQLSYDFVNQGSKVSIVARNLRSLKKIASNLNSIKPGNNFFSIDLMPEGNPTKIIKNGDVVTLVPKEGAIYKGENGEY